MTDLSVGAELWVPCVAVPGPFPDERLVTIDLGDVEWAGFVNDADLKEVGGRCYIRSVVMDVSDRGITVRFRGQSMGSNAIETPRGVLEQHGAIAG